MWNWISTHWQLLGSIAGGIVALDSYIMPFIPVKYSGVALIVNRWPGTSKRSPRPRQRLHSLPRPRLRLERRTRPGDAGPTP